MLPSQPPHDAPSVELSILMPCLNEARTVGACVQQAVQWLRDHRVHGEVLVADNGSWDGSQTQAEAAGARVIAAAPRGYGAALMAGIRAARGRFIIMADADGSYDLGALAPFLERLRAGEDLVVGNRFRGGIQPGAMPPLNRYFGNPLLTGLGRLFFRSPIGDFYCGLRGFRREAALAMDLRATGMEFAIELVVKATLLGMRVSEVPTTLAPDGRGRAPHLRPWRDGWRTLRFMLIYSPRWLFWYPGLALILGGLALVIWILPAPRTLGNVTIDVHTLLFGAMAIILGVQALSFWTFTTVFAVSEGLLPESRRLRRVFRVATLEVGLAAGAVCILLGLIGAVQAVGIWEAHAFGPLDISQTMRLVIPSVTLIVLGAQLILSSFFLSILWVRRREPSP